LSAAQGHPNVCRIYDRFIHGSLALLVLEACDRTLCEALEHIDALNEKSVRPFFRSMLSALSAVHARGIVHRDVKPANFMCSGPDDTVKLCDFGLASSVSSLDARTCSGVNGTAAFMAPEVTRDIPYGSKVDSWSFGVCVYVLLFGHFPYMPAVSSKSGMKEAIAAGTPEPPFQASKVARSRKARGVSDDAMRLVRGLLCRTVEERPTCSEALRYTFFVSKALSWDSLGPTFVEAKRCGAFGSRTAVKPKFSDVELWLRELQDKHMAHVSMSALSTECQSMSGSSLRKLSL